MDNTVASVEAVRETKHMVSIRIATADVPDLKKIMNAAARLGEVVGIDYNTYNY